MHWYHCVFYEPVFRKRLQSILDYGVVHEREGSLLLLLLIVLVTGARYLSPEKARSLPPELDLKQFETDLMQTIESKFMIAFDEGSLDSIAFLYLTASHYVLNGRPSRGFLFLGISVRVCQCVGLYNESLGTKADAIEQEMRRRLFWSHYVSDGYTSITPLCDLLTNDVLA